MPGRSNCHLERHRICSPVSHAGAAPRDAPHPVAFDQVDGRIVRIEQALAGFEDRVEDRRRGIPRCVGDRAQDFGAGLLLHPRGFQLPLQPCGLRLEGRLLLAGSGLCRFRLAQSGLMGFGHAGFAHPQPVGTGRRATLSCFFPGLGSLGLFRARLGIAPPHSITSSATVSRRSGAAIPRDFAVLRLSTSTNLLACSIGRSAGFSPPRILAA